VHWLEVGKGRRRYSPRVLRLIRGVAGAYHWWILKGTRRALGLRSKKAAVTAVDRVPVGA
jgi:hypothetical protein